MTRFYVRGIEFRLHALTIVSAVLALYLGASRDLPAVLIALLFHECAHILAAWACGLSIKRIDLMPFGGAAHIENMYISPSYKLVLVALAGPAANMTLFILAGALGWWDILNFPAAARMARVNLLLMLFNLLPALPLDGGRVLYAVCQKWLGATTAVRLGVFMAHLIATILLALCVAGFATIGTINITFVIASAFLIAASLSERQTVFDEGVSGAVRGLCSEKPLPARAKVVLAESAAPPELLTKYIKPGEPSIFAIINEGSLTEFVSEGDMLKRILKNG